MKKVILLGQVKLAENEDELSRKQEIKGELYSQKNKKTLNEIICVSVNLK